MKARVLARPPFILVGLGLVGFGNAFVTHETALSLSASSFRCRQHSRLHNLRTRRDRDRCRIDHCYSSSQLNAADAVAPVLSDFAPAATSLFNNMKLPAAVVTAGMISLGFATGFPELPEDTPERRYCPRLRRRCESLRRLHIVMASISVTSELVVVMWAAVEVNQLTERAFLPAASVWDLIQRDCDLAWSAVNSHFVLGIIGFVSMLAIRAYVMLLAAEASSALVSAAMSGTAAALCLMISVVNRGVEAGGGEGIGYGKTILDLFQHYVFLLFQCATDVESPGPLELSAIVLETASIGFALQVILFGESDKLESDKQGKMQDIASNGATLPLDLEPSVMPPTLLEQEKVEVFRMDKRNDKAEPSTAKKKAKTNSDSSVNIY